MASKFVRLGVLFIAALLVGNACSRKACTPGQPAPRPKWQATSPDGVALTIELKATPFNVLDRIDATVTVRNGSDDLVVRASRLRRRMMSACGAKRGRLPSRPRLGEVT